MRMYLSSFKLGNRPEALQELVGSDRRAAIVMNALDIFPDPRAQWLQAQSDALIKLGFSVSELDLRGYFGRENDLRGFACGEGLDLLPYAIAVHYKSDHPESSSTDREIEFYQANGIPYRALRDGQALVVDGATTKIVE